MRLATTVFGLFLLAASLAAGIIGYNDGGSHSIEIPDCTASIAGLQIGDLCDSAAMMDEKIPIAEGMVNMLDASLSMEWDVQGVWFGLVEASEASKCTDTGEGYLLCDPNELVFVAGGPASQNSLEWTAEAGEYRIVGGASSESSGVTVEVTYSFHVTLLTAGWLGGALVGGLLAAWGATRTSEF